MQKKNTVDNTFRFIRNGLGPTLRQRFNYSCDSLADIPGPILLLANHNTDLDPLFIGAALGRSIRFVATEHILRKKLPAYLLTHYANPIIHTKGKVGVKSTIDIIRSLKNGEDVCIFAEGNRSFYGVTGEIPEVTGKLAKKSGATLVTFRFEGGYFTQPRWGKGFRKGELRGRLAGVYRPEQLKEMTEDEVQKAICSDLHEDAYARQATERIPFKGSKLAEGLETALYRCPACGCFGRLDSKGSDLFCSCGWKVRMDEYGMLRGEDGSEKTVTELSELQHQALLDAVVEGADRPIFFDTVDVGEVVDHKVAEKRAARLQAYPDRFLLGGKEFRPEDLAGAAIFSRNTLLVHIESSEGLKQYEITGSPSFCAVKYLELYRILQAKGSSKEAEA